MIAEELRAKNELIKIGRNQTDLLAFVMAAFEEMDQKVRGFAIYMFVVIYRMFQEARGETKKISSGEIIECYDHNEALMERLEGAHEEFLDRIARVQTSRQSYLVNYVVDALMGEDERGDVLALTDEEKDFIFLVLKTVIDLLDQKVHSHEVVLELLSGSRLHISSSYTLIKGKE